MSAEPIRADWPTQGPQAVAVGQPDRLTGLATIPQALAALRQGRGVLVLDDADRENEGDVVFAAATMSDAACAWAIRHTSGYLCAPLTGELADRFELPQMVTRNEDDLRTAYTVTVDARTGVTTGISAADRARTARVLADPQAGPGDLIRPGHLVPLRARDGGVLVRGGHTEAAVDLCRLAGLPPVGVIGELVHDEGEMMRGPAVLELGGEAEMPVITIEDLIAWRRRHDRVQRITTTSLPTRHGRFTMHGYRDRLTGAEHVALVHDGGSVATSVPPLVRVHSECLTGDAFGSARCDCGPQLEQGMRLVARHGGAVVYLRGHEGRGVGLLAKLAAYALQDEGLDTVDAQTALGLPVDARDYDAAVAILHDLDLLRVELLTGNPAKIAALGEGGIEVCASRPVGPGATPENIAYLHTKAARMGHQLVSAGGSDFVLGLVGGGESDSVSNPSQGLVSGPAMAADRSSESRANGAPRERQ
ncbi:3,4-dihydroxy 2-butanone 4-phosphate synthase/GTP cyclohydrolase II [Kineosphaera limosa]|uniref:GTP cyclohydrolase-2 n=1 Tax=Kineosphaera limosa NBRC 100340 TaxID=1184609 RepID=K6WWM5_9MICO|nr:3,4-dihydroxy 2-butanone 4-phosphate synthase/GTP cyclohydrolase II [Kineosphaera limosa]GAB96507.1 GTP cyclohydrolase II [Kineosphaera limosa NBRC 100340]